MNSNMTKRGLNLIQEIQWHGEDTSKTREAINQKAIELSHRRDKLICDAKDLKESDNITKLSEVDAVREEIFDYLKQEIEVRTEVIEFYRDNARNDAQAYHEAMAEVLNTAEERLAKDFESIGFRPFNAGQPNNRGAWWPEMIQRHPMVVDNRAEMNALREWITAQSGSQRAEETLLAEAKAERKEITLVELPI